MTTKHGFTTLQKKVEPKQIKDDNFEITLDRVDDSLQTIPKTTD